MIGKEALRCLSDCVTKRLGWGKDANAGDEVGGGGVDGDGERTFRDISRRHVSILLNSLTSCSITLSRTREGYKQCLNLVSPDIRPYHVPEPATFFATA